MIQVNVHGTEISEEEKNAYVDYCKQKHENKSIETIDITVDDEYVDLHCTFEDIPFERIRRITGYLVGTVDRFNNAKRAEEKDRVKHDLH